jgi:large subunit ribosomal protein L10
MVKQYKVDAVKELIEKLSNKKNIILTGYSGIKDSEMRKLRVLVREKGASYKVVRNNLFRRALKDAGFSDAIESHLKGPIAVAFMGEQYPEVAKVFKEFKVEQEKFSFFLGVIDGEVHDEKYMAMIASIPTKDVLLTQTAALMNSVMSSLARGINAVAEKNNPAA